MLRWIFTQAHHLHRRSTRCRMAFLSAFLSVTSQRGTVVQKSRSQTVFPHAIESIKAFEDTKYCLASAASLTSWSSRCPRLCSNMAYLCYSCSMSRYGCTGANGLKTSSPSALKSLTFRVATVRPCTFAVAAIIASS